jgi:hypothetical protein
MPAGQEAGEAKERVLALFHELDVPVSFGKLVGPTRVLEFLGHELDSKEMVCRVTPAKKDETLRVIHELLVMKNVTRKELQSVFFLARVVKQGRPSWEERWLC